MTQSSPKISVVIPTRDRFAVLACCLESLARQNYPRDAFEVIVVNDASKLPVPLSITAFQDRLNLVISNQTRSVGPSVARNCGAALAKGAFIAFTDDDCAPAADWLQKLADHFASAPGDLIGGRVVNSLTQNPYSTAAHVILDVVYEYYDPRRGRSHFFPTSNLAVSTGRFRELGGFDEGWPLAAAEDREFCYRWLKHGFQMSYVPDAKVYHSHPLTLVSFCRLHFRYGRGAYNYHVLRGGGGGEGGLKPDWRFYWSCIRYPFEHLQFGRAAHVATLLFLWQIFNATGYCWERCFHNARETFPAS